MPVETVLVRAENVEVTALAVGTLKAEQSVDLKPKHSGRVHELRFQEGEQVRAGQILVVLDDRQERAQVDLARAAVRDAEVQRADAQREYDRIEPLWKKGIASQQDYDKARAALERAAAALDVAKASLAFAEAQLEETVIRAPFAGVVGQRRVDVGAFVKDGEPLVTLIDLDPVEIVFALPERYLSQLRPGEVVETRVASHTDRQFSGVLTFVDPQVDPVNRTVTAKASIPNEEGVLRPGQFAAVEVRLTRHPEVPVIPEEALVPDGDRTLVFVVENGSASARVVETGVRLPGRVEVVRGLRAGERIVRTGHEKLRSGTAIPVVDVAAGAES